MISVCVCVCISVHSHSTTRVTNAADDADAAAAAAVVCYSKQRFPKITSLLSSLRCCALATNHDRFGRILAVVCFSFNLLTWSPGWPTLISVVEAND